MPVVVSCRCGKQLRVSAEHVGQQVRCTGCRELLVVPDPAGPTRRHADDRPTPRRRGPGLVVGGSVVLLLLLGLVLLFLFSGGREAEADLALVPADAAGFVTVRPAELARTPLGQELLARLPHANRDTRQELETKLGLTLADLDRATFVTRTMPMLGLAPAVLPDSYAILTTAKPVDAAQVLRALAITELPKVHNGKQYHVRGDEAVYFHSERTTVIGNEAGVRMAIDQAVTPQQVGELSQFLAQVQGQHFVAGGKVPLGLGNLKQFVQESPAAGLVAALDVQAALLVGNVRNDTLELELAGTFATAAQAQALKEAVEGFKLVVPFLLLQAPPEVAAPAGTALNNLTTSVRGSEVVLGTKLKIDVRQLQEALPLGP